jgi:protease PrsW
MPFLVSMLFGFIPMLVFAGIIYWMDRYEKEPRFILGAVFSWGAIVAAGAAYLTNTALSIGVFLLSGSESTANITTGSLIAPSVEETLKGLAVLLVFWFFYEEFDSVLDGIVYAAITALGFAATENVFYIYNYGYLEQSWSGLFSLSFIRIVMVGWQHPFYTAFIGIGLATSRLSRSWFIRILAPMVGWIVAITAHSIHNTLAELFSGSVGLILVTSYDWIGWFVMFIFIQILIVYESHLIHKHLQDEMDHGIINKDQYQVASSSWRQVTTKISAIFQGRYTQTDRFYQVCAELAHKKHQYSLLGEENGNSVSIDHLRKELVVLAPQTL